ncbi:hypothetical protein [Parvibaculum sp.]
MGNKSSQKLDFNPDLNLLESLANFAEPPPDFNACLNAQGMYETMRFVLRLSPRNHDLVDSLSSGIHTVSEVSPEAFQAYSTYLHETVHWWQHVGSTSGLVLSLCYLAQSHSSLRQLRAVLAEIGGKKSLKRWADDVLVQGKDHNPDVLTAANIAVNNALDVEFYKRYAMVPKKAEEVVNHSHFESVGHCYFIVYGQLLGMLSDTVDPEFAALPNAPKWESIYADLRNRKHVGFYCGSPVYRPRVGLHAIFEGQARFIQLQFLDRPRRQSLTCEYMRSLGFLSGIYVEAFEEFLRLSESDWPSTIDDPLISLFLLICDLAINPTRGFPLDIVNMERFIEDVDVGVRFSLLSSAVRELPHLRQEILSCSRDEYEKVADELTAFCKYDHPFQALRAIADWAGMLPSLRELMEEHRTFEFNETNQPIRVFFSHFVSFSQDRLKRPEFFCWPGAWFVGDRASWEIGEIWLRHLSLFSDRGDKPGVYAREWPTRSPVAVKDMFNRFYVGVVLYDLVRQWILQDGPFLYEFDWLTQDFSQTQIEEWAKSIFERLFGMNPDNFEVFD